MNDKMNQDETQTSFLDLLLSACQLVTERPEQLGIAADELGITAAELQEVVDAYQRGGRAAVAAYVAPAS